MLKILIIDKSKNTCICNATTREWEEFKNITNFNIENVKKHKTRKELNNEISEFLKNKI